MRDEPLWTIRNLPLNIICCAILLYAVQPSNVVGLERKMYLPF